MKWQVISWAGALVVGLMGCGGDSSERGSGAEARLDGSVAVDMGRRGETVCDAFLATEDGAGQFCDGSGDCPEVRCPCADGSTVSMRSCLNNGCVGRDACAEACAPTGYACARDDDDGSDDDGAGDDGSGDDGSDDDGSGDDGSGDDGSGDDGSGGGVSRIPTGDPCPRTCGAPFQPATVACSQCEEGRCFDRNGTERTCTRSCSGPSDCADLGSEWTCTAGDCVRF